MHWDPNAVEYTFTAFYVITLPGSDSKFSKPMSVTGTIRGGHYYAPYQIHFSGTITDKAGTTETVDYQGTVTCDGVFFHTTGRLFDVVSSDPFGQPSVDTEGMFD
jgi:hypothetical protein